MRAAAWSPDGSWLATGHDNGSIRLNGSNTSVRHSAPITCMSWSADSSMVCAGDANGVVSVWRAGSLATMVYYTQTTDRIRDVALSRWGDYVAYALTGGGTYVRATDKGTAMSGEDMLPYGEKAGPAAVQLKWVGQQTLCRMRLDRPVYNVWVQGGGWMRPAVRLPGRWAVPMCVAGAWSPDQTRVAVADSCCCDVRVFDQKGEVAWRLAGHKELVTAVVWAPDGAALCTRDADGRALVWCMQTGTLLCNVTSPGCYNIRCVAWTPNGRSITLGGDGDCHSA